MPWLFNVLFARAFSCLPVLAVLLSFSSPSSHVNGNFFTICDFPRTSLEWVSRSTTKHLVLVSLDRWWLFTLYSRNDGCRHVMRRRNVWREQRGDTCKQVDWPKVVPPQPWRHAAYHSIVMKWCLQHHLKAAVKTGCKQSAIPVVPHPAVPEVSN